MENRIPALHQRIFIYTADKTPIDDIIARMRTTAQIRTVLCKLGTNNLFQHSSLHVGIIQV